MKMIFLFDKKGRIELKTSMTDEQHKRLQKSVHFRVQN